jgi:predicted metal-binding membrane protein
MRAEGHRSGTAPARSPQEGIPLWVPLALVGGLAWLVTAGEARTMGARPGTMDMAFPFFVTMWAAMMAAMMLPAIGPMATARALAAERRTARIPGALAFGVGFLLPWAAYGVLAFLALLGTERLVETSPEAARWLGVGIFAVTGLYQFSPWKLRALWHCRAPMHTTAQPGLLGALSGGIRDGAICVGCCWAFMAILLAVGVMNLPAMVGLAAVIFAEKILPRPRLIASLAGAVFLALAVVAAFEPLLLPGLTAADMGMQTGGMEMRGM